MVVVRARLLVAEDGVARLAVRVVEERGGDERPPPPPARADRARVQDPPPHPPNRRPEPRGQRSVRALPRPARATRLPQQELPQRLPVGHGRVELVQRDVRALHQSLHNLLRRAALLQGLPVQHLEVRQERVQLARRRPRVRLEAPDPLQDVPAQIAAQPGLALLRVHI